MGRQTIEYQADESSGEVALLLLQVQPVCDLWGTRNVGPELYRRVEHCYVFKGGRNFGGGRIKGGGTGNVEREGRRSRQVINSCLNRIECDYGWQTGIRIEGLGCLGRWALRGRCNISIVWRCAVSD